MQSTLSLTRALGGMQIRADVERKMKNPVATNNMNKRLHEVSVSPARVGWVGWVGWVGLVGLVGLVGWLVGLLACWLVGLLICRFAGLSVSWVVCLILSASSASRCLSS